MPMTDIGSRALPPPIRATLLGEVRIEIGGRLIGEDAWSLRNARSLFVLLLITRGHALPKERVLDLLWPEHNPELSRNALYKALHLLRRILEPDLQKGGASSYIDSRGGVIRLLPEVDIWVDVDACDTALKRAALADSAERRQLLRNAVSLCGGELLPTDSYEDWPVARREALHRAWESAALDLASLDLAANEPQASVTHLETLLSIDPAVEAAHQALMRVYAATGQRDRALRQFARCRLALNDELGSGPNQDTKALCAAIQAATPASELEHDVVSRRLNNLPAPPTPMIGRERDGDRVQGLLWRQDVRLVTLTGPGGVGKTRLAVDAASGLVEDFKDGVAFVPLATVREPRLVMPAIAQAVGISEQPNQPLTTTLHEDLRQRDLLLVLDNVEQVLEAAIEIGNLLESCPGVTVLVTSRERLRLRSEHVYEVLPLSAPHPDRPPSLKTLARYGSVALFREQLRLLQPDFKINSENSEVVTAICYRLEGLPLAIELAAARARFLDLDDLHLGLASRLDMLQEGPRDLPVRQRALRDTISWSHELLAEEEQAVFRRLAAFANGCTLAATEAVCGIRGEGDLPIPAGIRSLAEKHLIGWDETDHGPRITMLETIREFAMERLAASDEGSEIRRRHAIHYLNLAAHAEDGLVGSGQLVWIERLETEHANIRAALGWALEQPGDEGTLAVRAAAALWRFWWSQGLLSEGITWLERAAARSGTDAEVRASALQARAELYEVQSDYRRAAGLFSEALSISRKGGDGIGVAKSLTGLGQIAQDQGEFDRAATLHREALELYRQTGRRRDSAGSLNNLATVAYYCGDIDAATALWEDALTIVRELGDFWAAGLVLGNLGAAALKVGDFDRAVGLHQENLSVARHLKDPGAIGRALCNLSEAMEARGDGDQDALLEEALILNRKFDDKQAEVSTLAFMAHSDLKQGKTRDAASLYAESLALCLHIGDRTTIANIALLERIAALAIASDQARPAARMLGASETLREALGAPLMPYLRSAYDRSLRQVNAALGETASDAAFTDGRALQPEAAFAEAMAVCEYAQRESGA